jgi:hypothetical protein
VRHARPFRRHQHQGVENPPPADPHASGQDRRRRLGTRQDAELRQRAIQGYLLLMRDRLRHGCGASGPVLIALLAIPLAGCFQSTTIIHVKTDGSGTIEQRTLLTETAMDQLRTLSILGGGNPDAADPTTEAQARTLATAIGTGVTYVSSTPLKLEKSAGRETLYAFTDITQLRVSEQPNLPGGVKLPASVGGDTAPISFALDKKPGGNVVLRIIVPRPAIFPTGPNGEPQPPSLDQITLVKQLLAGARLTVAMEPEGRLVQTSSPFVDGNRVTLIDLDIDRAAADPDLAKKLQTGTTQPEIKAALNSIPGLKITLDPEITIEFSPK